MTPIEDIVGLWRERKSAQHPVIAQMTALRDAYNGDLIVPLPELDKNEKSSVANYVALGLDQTAMRIASTTPDIFYPALDPGNRASERRAATRRRANLGWWEANKVGLKMRRRARFFIGYASSPVILRPDYKLGCARWEVRDPLSTFPSPTDDVDDMSPPNVIFSYQRTGAWLRRSYPGAYGDLWKGKQPDLNDRFDIVEYADDVETVLLACGQSRPEARSVGWSEPSLGQDYVELERIPNRTGQCLAVVPGRITLDRPQGQFDATLGMLQTQAKLMALDLIAVQKSVMPPLYLVGKDGKTPRYLSGPFTGESGMVNVVTDGQPEYVELRPGFQTGPMIDRLERNQRITGGTPAEFGGESQTNVRTGKRGDAILSAVVDFPVQEAQDVFAASMVEENKRAVAIAKAYFGNRKSTFYVGSQQRRVDYIPNKDFESDNNIVTYPHPGADVNGLIIGVGQRIGIGTMSKRTGMEMDPMVDDADREHDRVTFEQLEAAVLQGIQQQAATGAIPLTDLAAIMSAVVQDKKSLVDAVMDAQKKAQERQATPVEATAPEAQPGMAQPGVGAEQPVVDTPGPSANVDGLAQLLGSLNRPAQVAAASARRSA